MPVGAIILMVTVICTALSGSLMFGNIRCWTISSFSAFGYVDLPQLDVSPAKMGLLCNNKELQFGSYAQVPRNKGEKALL